MQDETSQGTESRTKDDAQGRADQSGNANERQSAAQPAAAHHTNPAPGTNSPQSTHLRPAGPSSTRATQRFGTSGAGGRDNRRRSREDGTNDGPSEERPARRARMATEEVQTTREGSDIRITITVIIRSETARDFDDQQGRDIGSAT
ncbi:hypothetical protein OC834_006451 [Tilletia horrida]|nr:hypothetical protein OC834_006451 [Tilletia horrida]